MVTQYELWETFEGEKSLIGTWEKLEDAYVNKEWFEENSVPEATYEVIQVEA